MKKRPTPKPISIPKKEERQSQDYLRMTKEEESLREFMAKEGLDVEMGFIVMINAQNTDHTYKELFDSFNALWKQRCDEYNKGRGKKNQFVKPDYKYFRATYGPQEEPFKVSFTDRVADRIRKRLDLK